TSGLSETSCMLEHRDWRLLVQDIIEHGERVEQYTHDLDFESFAANQMVVDATVRNLEIMGEAARHVPPEVQARCPEVAWRQMNDRHAEHPYSRVQKGRSRPDLGGRDGRCVADRHAASAAPGGGRRL